MSARRTHLGAKAGNQLKIGCPIHERYRDYSISSASIDSYGLPVVDRQGGVTGFSDEYHNYDRCFLSLINTGDQVLILTIWNH